MSRAWPTPVTAEGAGVGVADHGDQPRPENGEQRAQPCPHVHARSIIVAQDGAERALDVAEIGSGTSRVLIHGEILD
jgi:hypothetical protein